MIKYAKEESLQRLEGKIDKLINSLDGSQSPEDMYGKTMGIEQVMKLLRVTTRQRIYQLVKAGELDKISARGKKCLFLTVDVMNYIKGR